MKIFDDIIKALKQAIGIKKNHNLKTNISKNYEMQHNNYIFEEKDSCENSLKELWQNGTESAWKQALNHYYGLLKGDQRVLEDELYAIGAAGVEKMEAQEFYDFLYNKYFVWKYTAKNRLATTRKILQKYVLNNELQKLERIKVSMLSTDKADVAKCLDIVTDIYGLGTAGASGLLSILFPKEFGTVDQFVVKSLCEVGDSRYAEVLKKMKPESLSNKDGVVLEKILREKAAELNSRFNTDFWTPRKLDMILWSFGR